MRFARIITAIVAFALIGLLPQSSASAVQPVTKASASESSAAVTAPTKVARKAGIKIGIKIVKRKGKLLVVGRITPAKPAVRIERATACNYKANPVTCNFKPYKKIKVSKAGHYETRVYAPKKGSWAWRARINKNFSDIWVTCTRTSPGAQCPKV